MAKKHLHFQKANKLIALPVLVAITGPAFAAESIGIGFGKGYRSLDINVYRSVDDMRSSFRSSPNFDPSRGVPKLVPIE